MKRIAREGEGVEVFRLFVSLFVCRGVWEIGGCCVAA